MLYVDYFHINFSQLPYSVQFSSVAQLCLTLCNPMDCSKPGLSVHHQLPELIQIQVHWVGDAIQPSHPVSSIFPSIRVFSSESVLHIRWPKYWSFSFFYIIIYSLFIDEENQPQGSWIIWQRSRRQQMVELSCKRFNFPKVSLFGWL